MTFIVPASFTVYGVPQRERRRCLIQCDVVELQRINSYGSGLLRGARPMRTIYTAYVRLPGWITPPDGWPRLETGEVELTVPMHINQRVEFPLFPFGDDRVRPDTVQQLGGEPC